MQKPRAVSSTETLLSNAIASCPSSAALYGSLQALRTPLTHLKHLTNLDVDAWQDTLNELGNFAEDVVALLSRYQQNDEESEQRLKELHASAVNHELDLDARGFLTAFHPSHAHAAQIRDLSTCANAPSDCLQQVFHSLPALLTCVHTLITLPITANTIENAVRTALKASAVANPFPPADAIAPEPQHSRYASLRSSVKKYVEKLHSLENGNPQVPCILKFLHMLTEPGVLQEKRLKLYPPIKPFQLPPEIGRSMFTTVYKANTSVYDGDKHLWITKIALKAYSIIQTSEFVTSHFHLEALRLRSLSHPCLPAFYGYYWPSPDSSPVGFASDFENRPYPPVLLATELMTKNLSQARALPALRPLKARLRVLRDIADALSYLHGQKLHHGRLNPGNILLRMSKNTIHGRVKVDVTSLAGRVLLKDGIGQVSLTSALYLAPESLKPGPAYFTGDVWSLGMIGCFLMTDTEHFWTRTCGNIFSRIASEQPSPKEVETWCASRSETRVRSIIGNCLQIDPAKRSDSLSVMRALNNILDSLCETGPCLRKEYSEEIVDGSIVDEIIDSNSIEDDLKRTKRILRKQDCSPTEGRFEPTQELHSRSPKSDETSGMRDIPHFVPHITQNDERQDPAEDEALCSRKIVTSAVSFENKDLHAAPRKVVGSNSESNDIEDSAYQFILAENLEMGRGVDQDIPKAIDLYQSAHQKGYVRATFRLGQCYLIGLGVQKCYTTALHLLEQAANTGHVLAMMELGRSYETGRGVKEAPTTSANWFRRAAESGSPEGLRCYAKCLLEGFGVKEDRHQAVFLLTRAHSGGDVSAGYELALCLREGLGSAKDPTKACELLEWAAQRCHADAQLEFANSLYYGLGTERDLARAYEMYRRSAGQGHMDALRHLGECYELGHGVKKDINKAVDCFRKASDAGNASAMSSLAGCYERGEGVSHDMKKAIQLYRKAERKNDYLALNNLGVMFERGMYLKQDLGKAVKYYKKAMELGFTEAACNLADCYLNGNGVRKDIRKAISLYDEAAAERHAGAKCELGRFHYRGLGVAKDYNRAVTLFREACDVEPEASRLLGIAFIAGNGVKRNLDEAARLFAESAKSGNSEANLNLGLCSMEGLGVSRCLSRAVSQLTEAANGGSKEALLILGNMYYEGRGVQQDIRRAVMLFLKGEKVDLDMI